jgi:hypothetical protein
MPSIRASHLLACCAVALALTGCGEKNDLAVFSPENGHSSSWATAHKTAAKTNVGSCVECHADENGVLTTTGGKSLVSCGKCHLGGVESVHPLQWGDLTYARHSRYISENGNSTQSCAVSACHGTGLSGFGNAPSCAEKCHLGNPVLKHAGVWGQFSSHANYVTSHNNDITKCSTEKCHGTVGNAQTNAPGCTVCHLGGTFAVHPATATAWTTAHQGYTLSGKTVVETRAKCDIAACHGTFNDATKPGQAKANKSCGVACHAGDKN